MAVAQKKQITAGLHIGRWTVLDNYILTPKGSKKWLCQCSCGTQRYVLESSLRYGGSLSCGCAREENARQAINTIGLDGVLYFLGFKDSYLEERGKL